MKTSKLYFKLAAMFLCIALVISAINPSTSNAQESEYYKIQKKIQEQYKQGIPEEEILMNLSDSEKKTFLNYYTNMSSVNLISMFDIDQEDLSEMTLIDTLATEYYASYEQYGYYPVTEEGEPVNQSLMFSTTQDETDASNFSVAVSSMAYDESKIMLNIGYSYTIAQIALHLAKFGALFLDYALPFLILVTILAGTVLLVYNICAAYAMASADTATTIGIAYYNHNYEIAKSKQESAVMVVAKQNGCMYWEAYLANYFGYGGISIGNAINDERAREIVKENNELKNVFTLDRILATNLASSIGRGYVKGPEVHRENNKLLNWQHVHAWPEQNSSLWGFTHIFYATPLDYPLS